MPLGRCRKCGGYHDLGCPPRPSPIHLHAAGTAAFVRAVGDAERPTEWRADVKDDGFVEVYRAGRLVFATRNGEDALYVVTVMQGLELAKPPDLGQARPVAADGSPQGDSKPEGPVEGATAGDAHVYDPLRDAALKKMAEVYDAQASEYLARAETAEAERDDALRLLRECQAAYGRIAAPADVVAPPSSERGAEVEKVCRGGPLYASALTAACTFFGAAGPAGDPKILWLADTLNELYEARAQVQRLTAALNAPLTPFGELVKRFHDHHCPSAGDPECCELGASLRAAP